MAKADAERIKVLGLAEAAAIGDVGKADAERMLAKAKVYRQYGDAAIMALVLEALPKVRKTNENSTCYITRQRFFDQCLLPTMTYGSKT